jgi:hypothetical protein
VVSSTWLRRHPPAFQGPIDPSLLQNASALLDAARDLALGYLRSAVRLERAKATVGGPSSIQKRLATMDPVCRVQQLALGADIEIAVGVEGEVIRLSEPSSRLDLSMTRMCRAIFVTDDGRTAKAIMGKPLHRESVESRPCRSRYCIHLPFVRLSPASISLRTASLQVMSAFSAWAWIAARTATDGRTKSTGSEPPVVGHLRAASDKVTAASGADLVEAQVETVQHPEQRRTGGSFLCRA